RFYRTKDIERLRAIMKLKSLGLSLREIRELLQSPGDGPYGLNANWCEKIFERLSVQRAEADAGLTFLRDFLGCRCRAPAQRAVTSTATASGSVKQDEKASARSRG